MSRHDERLILPDDEYNRQLVANVHPSDWVNPEPSGRYNIVVIGAGTAGLITAVIAASLGAKVALIEKHLMGGDCLNVGCVPSKGMLRAARAWSDLKKAGEFGLHIPPGVTYDFGAVMARMRQLRARISRNDSAHRYKSLGVDVFIGHARFAGPDTVLVEGTAGQRTLPFVKAAICTGARASVPPIPGLQEAGYLTNETVFSLTELPLVWASSERGRSAASWRRRLPDSGVRSLSLKRCTAFCRTKIAMRPISCSGTCRAMV